MQSFFTDFGEMGEIGKNTDIKMLDFSTIEKFDKIATPFYYYDMDLLRKTVDHVAELAAEHDIRIHYAVKANVERRLLRSEEHTSELQSLQ